MVIDSGVLQSGKFRHVTYSCVTERDAFVSLSPIPLRMLLLENYSNKYGVGIVECES